MDKKPVAASKSGWSSRRHQKAFKKIANYLKIQALLKEITEQEHSDANFDSIKQVNGEEI
jgi:hypothetical protein